MAEQLVQGGGGEKRWLEEGDGVTCFWTEITSGNEADFNCGFCSRM